MKLTCVKTVHSVFYLIEAAAIAYILLVGLSGRRGPYLRQAFALVAFESVVYLGNGGRCPLSAMARRWGDPTGHVGDTLFSERLTRHTFALFGSLLALGTALVALRARRGLLR